MRTGHVQGGNKGGSTSLPFNLEPNWPPQHLHVFHSICVQCIVFVLVEILKQTSTKVCEVWEMRQQNKTGNKLQTTPLVSQVAVRNNLENSKQAKQGSKHNVNADTNLEITQQEIPTHT